jgi:hypothetical protein
MADSGTFSAGDVNVNARADKLARGLRDMARKAEKKGELMPAKRTAGRALVESNNGKLESDQAPALEPITPVQQAFINELLTGKSITGAALIAGVSRRAATYWLQGETSVRIEYERARMAAQQKFYDAYNGLVEKAMEQLDAALESPQSREMRFAAAKFIFTLHFARGVSAPPVPESAGALVEAMIVRTNPLADMLAQMDDGPERYIFDND